MSNEPAAEDRSDADGSGPRYHTPGYGTPPSPWAAPGGQPAQEPAASPRFEPPPPPPAGPLPPPSPLPRFDVPPTYGAPGYTASYPPAPGPASPGYGAPGPVSPGYGVPGYGYAPVSPAYGAPGLAVPPAAAAASMRVDVIEGTQFGVAYPAVPPTPSGPSIGSLVAGIISILVSFVVGCFGLVGSTDGWGPAVSGAFAILAALIGAGSIGMGVFGLRHIRRSNGTVRGRGMAIAGISCGGSGIGLTLLLFLFAVLATADASSVG